MHCPKRWNLAPPDPAARELAGQLKTSVLIAQVLLNRGLRELGDCQAFLRPSLKLLHDPFLIPGLRQAAERIAQAIRDKQKIVVYGDYDVDGITATSILWHAIRVLGGQCDYYIPHRIDEGYGLNPEAIAALCDKGAQLIITVDCGITAIVPAAVARQRGVDLIITDHHEWRETTDSAGVCSPEFPDCYAKVHPRLPQQDGAPADPSNNGQRTTDNGPYPNPHLCGAGVAFKLAWGIGLAMSGGAHVSPAFREFLVEATALAALGTIADVVPLVGENRVLAHAGLSGLKASKLTGIRALIESANLTGQKLDSVHVGFLLAPRLNACGRMGHARLAVEMLTDADLPRAIEIATYLEDQNRQRQEIEKKILDQAMAQIAEHQWDDDDSRAIVLGDPAWHPGVIGIVASRIVDRFHRPAIMVALNNGHGQGSGRSIAGFHLAHALQACGQYLEGFGGHEMAAGLKVDTTQFEAFRESFRAYAATQITSDMLCAQIHLDATAEVGQLTPALVADLQRLGPFGHGNRRPIVCLRNVELSAPPRRVGRTGQHLQLHIRQNGQFIKCIAFGFGDLFDQLQVGVRLDLAAEPTLNTYNGATTAQLEIKDVQFLSL